MTFRFRHCHSRSRRLSHDELEHVLVGDPDPTSHPGKADGYRECEFEWADEISRTFILLWSCTRELGHQGQHIAGTGEWVAAVRNDQESGAIGEG
jgi:hypothetical protein